ncbi:hypothetical protein COU62_00575 [Candidatus Pacearchaeota archaeon CG10_big_fil_rev_8_21_14_0_10_35_219]|nr:hypothetical protein [Candidatus Pacearchaeota archaeon]OIO42691.1 MAG: hypothetical protein AUJ63_02150 [Candidatus Pacearchaeota archaeon CG1_02_35_32]PIO08285.1 MAG: hypothetical protein COU62_00575 [Candidatus Pacearchaeota archaeon CG10_big_fil_rev_8_21_14_0_10_35_219]PIY81886.1 MAG: hypothetical protein COY79_00315 [Candidatus Pacearchaeota archaeon CG_4_10_14_0_8_um_filter_35_169]PIZ79373.1 MAG: hypothetical protein COY00_04320 [Candidatus Pacearchaeota archaeon CG_4_10_14_0_2_um_filt
MRSIIKGRRVKGQAAMEFLMTYGWAILAAIIAIGVLAYFGVFSPSRLAGPAGIISPPFNLDDFNIVSGTNFDNVTMVVTQNLGESIKLSATSTDGSTPTTDGFAFILPDGTACPITDDVVSDSGGVNIIYAGGEGDSGEDWVSGSQTTIIAKCDAGSWAAGDAIRGDITMRYKKSSSSLQQTLQQISQGNVRGPSQ